MLLSTFIHGGSFAHSTGMWRNNQSAFRQGTAPLSIFTHVALACLLLWPVNGRAQEEGQEPPPLQTPASPTQPDPLLPKITAAVQGVTHPDAIALAKALGVEQGQSATGAASNMLTPVGDLDGDGVAELLLRWAAPEATPGPDVAPAPDSQPAWCVYLLSWDGAHWRASRLVTAVEHYSAAVIHLGRPLGRGLAIVTREGESAMPYPAIFQVENHIAKLLWDAQSDESLYKPLLQGQVEFQDHANAAAEMIVTGRADPGLLQFAPEGHRGFKVRAVYRWDGKSFTPGKTDYAANEDYTLYRFISALHLHDYRSAYALVSPAQFLHVESPTLDAFREYVQNHLAEFLQDEVFEAPETRPPALADQHLFVLSTQDKRNVYHPSFSRDGKFLLTGLIRTHEASRTIG